MKNFHQADNSSEPLDDEERILMDPETWDWESAEVAIVEPHAHSITEVRLSYDELSRLERVARAEGMTVAAFLKFAALERARQQVLNSSHSSRGRRAAVRRPPV
jgi:hypothetical protein